ncbi:hypothetical protein IFM51744_11209 [Aspergillus udagawae]|nr:hypothetical protein IFM51744_11209 [Aspergillus udagawae]
MALPTLPVELHFEMLDKLIDTQQPITHANLCAIRNYAALSHRHYAIVDKYMHARIRWNYFRNMVNQFRIWDSPADAIQHAQMPPVPPVVEPEPDVLSGAIRSHCVPCYRLLRDRINFPLDRFNDFGWCFLGLALTVGSHEIARDIIHHVDYPHDVTGRANVKNVASESIIRLAAQTGDERIFEPIYDRIPAGNERITLVMHIDRHERARLCLTSSLALAMRLSNDGCNIADGLDSGTQDTSWHYAVRNPCGPLFMDWLRANQSLLCGPDSVNRDGETPLMVSVLSNCLDTMKWLTVLGVNIQYARQDGTTAAHLAAKLQTNESIEMLETLLPRANLNSGHQTAAGTILHALVDGVRSAKEQLSNDTTRGRRRFGRQYRNYVYKKYSVIKNYRLDRTLTNAAGLTAVQYAFRSGLRDLANFIDRESYDLRPR